MASTMIHLMLAYEIYPNACGSYFVGSFAPDVFHKNRSDTRLAKNKNHFRDVPDMEAALTEFYSQIDRDNPFHEGYFVHLICDMWWYEDIDKLVESNPCKQGWYDNLKNEYRTAGVWIRRNMPWGDDIFNRMSLCSDNFESPMPDPTNEEIVNYKNGLLSPSRRIKDNEVEGEPSAVFTPEFLESYSNSIAKKYKSWVKDIA